MTIHEILDENHVAEAAALVKAYYTETLDHGEIRTGARFDSWAGGGEAPNVVNVITADDLLAVTFLAVDVPAPAVIGILETRKDEISGLLEQIPAGLDLAYLSADGLNALMGEGSPALQLWRILRRTESDRWGIGPTTASKIMARKRPRLIPIFDSVIAPLMGMKDSRDQWTIWHSVLTDGNGLPERLKRIHELSGVAPEGSAIRVMDVILWMHGKNLANARKSALKAAGQ